MNPLGLLTTKDGTELSNDQLLTQAEVANLLRYSPRTVRRMTQSGELRAINDGRLLRYRMGDIRRWQMDHMFAQRE